MTPEQLRNLSPHKQQMHATSLRTESAVRRKYWEGFCAACLMWAVAYGAFLCLR